MPRHEEVAPHQHAWSVLRDGGKTSHPRELPSFGRMCRPCAAAAGRVLFPTYRGVNSTENEKSTTT
jgi:hypothetical protein